MNNFSTETNATVNDNTTVDYSDYEEELDLQEEESATPDEADCWNCGGLHFIDGYGGMTICRDCKEIQDDDEDEFSRDDTYDHW